VVATCAATNRSDGKCIGCGASVFVGRLFSSTAAGKALYCGELGLAGVLRLQRRVYLCRPAVMRRAEGGSVILNGNRKASLPSPL
jgi:hypothetical protein